MKHQRLLPIHDRGQTVDAGFRIDLLVLELVIIELKAVEKIVPIHEAQLLTYLKLTKLNLGLLLNSNTTRLIDGVRRVVYNFPKNWILPLYWFYSCSSSVNLDDLT